MKGWGALRRGLVDGMSYEYMIPLKHLFCGLKSCVLCTIMCVVLTRQYFNSFIRLLIVRSYQLKLSP